MSTELKQLMKNYATKNTQPKPWEQDWCISLLPGKITQANLMLPSKKSYDYACRYPVAEGDVAIIGYALPQGDYDTSGCDSSTNTGQIATVTAVLPKLTIKRSHAVEVSFVFTPAVQKKNLTQCVKYLEMGADKYDKTLQLEKHINMIRPISYFIRCILAAASILAHPNFTKPEEQELAKSVIDRKYTVTKEMVELECSPSGAIGIDFMDIHTPDEHAPVALEVPDFECKQFEWKNGILQQGIDWKVAEKAVSGNLLCSHVNKYVHCGAVSIMVRGGFKNLLEAYLSVNPPIDAFYDEMCEILSDVGHKEVYEILKAYRAED